MVVHKGRGATENPGSRFVARSSVPIDDGWSLDPEPITSPKTELYADRTITLITKNQSPDVPFNQSINPYKGCEHGCVYCFARPTHAYLDLSPGLDFETKIFFKTHVRERLCAEIGKKSYLPQTIAMGTNTDPYQPAEKKLGVTREILETLLEYRHPVSIVTKGQLILRDVDLLSELAAKGLVSVMVSVTTLSNELKTKMEPRTASPAARLRVIQELNRVGVPVGAMFAPVIPFVNDHEMEAVVAAGAAAGVRTMKYVLLRLPFEVKDLFEKWLDVHYPLKAQRVMNAIRSTRRGKAYDSTWGKRMRGEGPVAELIAQRFNKALKANGLHDVEMPELRRDLFRSPGHQQMALF
ncbi:MAG: PA0069 family radical SAM protein [Gammaproteobacteria bacterium]|nr:PA0069 family radical SAM protein [Gammaproteobacteria bacterium]